MWQNTCLSLSCKQSLSYHAIYVPKVSKLCHKFSHFAFNFSKEQCMWAELPLLSRLWCSPKLIVPMAFLRGQIYICAIHVDFCISADNRGHIQTSLTILTLCYFAATFVTQARDDIWQLYVFCDIWHILYMPCSWITNDNRQTFFDKVLVNGGEEEDWF